MNTKIAGCVICGVSVVASKFVSPTKVKCPVCKKKKKVTKEFQIDWLRQSHIQSYIQCPSKFYETQEDDYKEDTIFTKMGTAIHAMLEHVAAGRAVEEVFNECWEKYGPEAPEHYHTWRKLLPQYIASKNITDVISRTIATELTFQIVLPNGVKISGTMDRVERIDADTIKITDYKTNMVPYTQDQLDTSIQLSMYRLAAEFMKDQLGPFDKVILAIDSIRGHGEQVTIRSKQEMLEFMEYLKVIWNKIQSGENRQPNLNQYCAYCQKRHRCALYVDIVGGQYIPPILTITVEDLSNADISAIVRGREELRQVAKIIEGRIAELDTQLKFIMDANNGTFVHDGTEYYPLAQRRYSYEPNVIHGILTAHGIADKFVSLVNISNTTMKEVLKDNPEALTKIEESAIVQYTKPSIKTRKVRNN